MSSGLSIQVTSDKSVPVFSTEHDFKLKSYTKQIKNEQEVYMGSGKLTCLWTQIPKWGYKFQGADDMITFLT